MCGPEERTMSQAAEGKPDQPSMLERAEEIQQQIQHISGRDWQLWSIGILIMLVLMAGLLALFLPSVVWSQRILHLDLAYLPQCFFGLISLIVLVNIYLLGQKFTLNTTRRALIRELVLNERLESLSLIDPLTQLLNRRAMNEFIPREVARANRLGAGLTFFTLDIDKFRSINTKFGSLEGDMLLTDFAKMLKLVFRGGDMVFRQGGDEFLVLTSVLSAHALVFGADLLHKAGLSIRTDQAPNHRHRAGGVEDVDHRLRIAGCNLHSRVGLAGGRATDQQRQFEAFPFHLLRDVRHFVE